MNKKKRIVTVFIMLLFLLLPSVHVFAGELELKRVADGVYAFISVNGGANSGFIITDEGVVVIDTQGPSDLALELKKRIRELTKKPIVYVINTHYHGDHTFGNQYFIEAREIIAHRKTRENLTLRHKEHIKRFKRFFGEERAKGIVLTMPTLTFEHGFTLQVGGVRIEVAYLGIGHTNGDIIVFLPDDKVLFAGDLLYNKRLPWVGDGNTLKWVGTLKRLSRYDADIYIPGHGDVGGRDVLDDFTGYLRELQAEVERLINEGRSLKEIKSRISLPKYEGYLKYKEWLSLNAIKVYNELKELKKTKNLLH